MNGSKPMVTSKSGAVSDDEDDHKQTVFSMPSRSQSTKSTKKNASGTLKAVIRTVSSALRKIIAYGPNPDGDEMEIDVDPHKIVSFFREEDVLRLIARMMETEEVYIWQFQGEADTEWTTMDMTLCLYLHILPLAEPAHIWMADSGLRFTVTRWTDSSAILKYNMLNVGGHDIEFNARRVSTRIVDGVYIPSLWERDLVNRSLSRTYLHAIDLKVLEIFGGDRYAVWWQYLKDWVRTERAVKVSTMESWITFHSFHLYSNWKCATQRASKLVRLWYVDMGRGNVMKNGFSSKGGKETHGDGSRYRFFLRLEKAAEFAKKYDGKGAEKEGVGRVLLCNVCITEQNEQALSTGKDFVRLPSSALCAYPELCVRIKI